VSRITGWIPGLVPGRESVLTRSGEPVKKKMTEAPEPKDKLDAATSVVVNGPEDATLDWRQIDWRACEANVRRLRQRIFAAAKAGHLAKVSPPAIRACLSRMLGNVLVRF
jgi:N-terminal domain of reverse transcriptase